MWVTGRQAASMLVEVGVTRRRATTLLACGMAGQPVPVGGSLLFDHRRVAELAARPFAEPAVAMELSERGMFVCRRDVDVSLPRADLLASVARGWEAVSPWALLRLKGAAQRRPVAFVVTVRGFVVLGADLCDTHLGPAGAAQLVLVEPGPWFAQHLEGRRLRSRQGRPWEIRWPDPHRHHGKMSA